MNYLRPWFPTGDIYAIVHDTGDYTTHQTEQATVRKANTLNNTNYVIVDILGIEYTLKDGHLEEIKSSIQAVNGLKIGLNNKRM